MRLSDAGQKMTGSGWIELVLAFALFLATHSVPARPAVRRWLVGRLGERGYLLAYSLTSVIALALLIAAAGRAPHLELWTFEPWQMGVPGVAMPLVCLLIAFSVGAPNPLSFGGRSPETFDPDRPGIVGVTRHPLLWALALWAISHVVPNGDLAHVMVFAGFAGFALVGMVMIDRRLKRRMGLPEWRRLAARTAVVPFGALLAGRWRPKIGMPSGEGWSRFLAGLALYAGLAVLHEPVVGVPVTAPFLVQG
jgi:uncharacterized membrane protein